FETELLTGIKINTLEDAKNACNALHQLGIPNVVITSSILSNDETLNEEEKGLLHLVGSEQSTNTQFRISFPRLDGYFTGSGDFFAALLMARLTNEKSLKSACELATSTQVGVMRATKDYQDKTGVPVPQNLVRGTRPANMVRGFELRIIPSQHLITSPNLDMKAIDI
ncbi:putative pyridoxal kinase, partial [Dipsacomyces acuminosporus]